MVVVALDPDMDRRAERIGEGAEDVAGHLGRIGADMAGFERALETAVGSAAEVDQDMRLGLVHRQREAEAADAAAAVERLRQRLAEGDRRILEAVMGVDLEIALAGDGQREAAMGRDLVEHMVEEGEAGVDPPRLGAVEVDGDRDLRLLGLAHQLGAAAIRRLGCQAQHGEQGRLLDARCRC